MSVNDQIIKGFDLKLTCKKCGGKEVNIEFYEGYIHDCGGDVGHLILECIKCKNELKVHDDD